MLQLPQTGIYFRSPEAFDFVSMFLLAQIIRLNKDRHGEHSCPLAIILPFYSGRAGRIAETRYRRQQRISPSPNSAVLYTRSGIAAFSHPVEI